MDPAAADDRRAASAAAGHAARRRRPDAAGTAPGGLPQPEDGEPELEPAGSLLDEEDDEDTGYGQIMVSMTRPARRDPPPYPE